MRAESATPSAAVLETEEKVTKLTEVRTLPHAAGACAPPVALCAEKVASRLAESVLPRRACYAKRLWAALCASLFTPLLL
jgi:hypothetical protein